MKKRRPIVIFWSLVAVAIIVLAFLSVTAGLTQKWLWMRQLGYQNIFWQILSIKWSLFGLVFLCVFFYLWINLRFAAKTVFSLPEVPADPDDGALYTRNGIRISPALPSVSNLFISSLVEIGRASCRERV